MFRSNMYNQQRRRRQQLDPYVLLLFFQLWQQVERLPAKPPVTLGLVAANLLIHFRDLLPLELPLIPSIVRACLQPYTIIKSRQWGRLIWSAFLHADEMHVYYNMSSLVWKGVNLEQSYGSVKFAALVGELLLLSHGLVLAGSALLASYIPEYRYLYNSTCAVGFSAVLFALKVVLNHRSADYSSIMGITLPTKYLCWAELLLASYLNPNSSFFGHLCGILAGWLHVVYIEPFLIGASRWGRRSWRSLQNSSRPRYAGTSRSAAAGSSSSGASASGAQGANLGGGISSSQGTTGLGQTRTRAGATAAAAPTNGNLAGSSHAAAGGVGGAADTDNGPLSLEELRQLRLQRLAVSQAVGRSGSGPSRRVGRAA